MRMSTLFESVGSGQLMLLLGANRLLTPVYRTFFVAAAAECGLLRLLAAGPVSLERVAAELGVRDDGRDALEAWLAVGVRLGDLGLDAGGYRLRSRIARALGVEANDAVLAFFEEAVDLHRRLLLETPSRLRSGRRFTLADQDGALVARSSRIAEPIVREAIDEAVPVRGPLRLLEVGCGSGIHVKYAAERNPELSALCFELQPEVAEQARENLRAWGLAARTVVEAGDVRDRVPKPEFDLLTLHQNIYYFPVAERVAVLARLRGWLRPGGRILLTTVCRGGGPVNEILSLWGAVTEGCGRLPDPDELVEQLRQAGFQRANSRNLLPGQGFHRFLAVA
jgi:SAM-dependent methyltransferase